MTCIGITLFTGQYNLGFKIYVNVYCMNTVHHIVAWVYLYHTAKIDNFISYILSHFYGVLLLAQSNQTSIERLIDRLSLLLHQSKSVTIIIQYIVIKLVLKQCICLLACHNLFLHCSNISVFLCHKAFSSLDAHHTQSKIISPIKSSPHCISLG